MPVSKEPVLQSLFLLLRESGGGGARIISGSHRHRLTLSLSICVFPPFSVSCLLPSLLQQKVTLSPLAPRSPSPHVVASATTTRYRWQIKLFVMEICQVCPIKGDKNGKLFD